MASNFEVLVCLGGHNQSGTAISHSRCSTDQLLRITIRSEKKRGCGIVMVVTILFREVKNYMQLIVPTK